MRCIEYKGYIGNAGYGLDYDPETQKTIGAHRLVFKQTYGYLPPVVMHTCDNPVCVNPEHLKAGSQKDNIQDCVRKGRYVGPSKLNAMQVAQIRADIRSQRAIAIDYGVDPSTIANVKNKRYSTDT